MVHNETATGVTSDIGAVRKAIDAAKHPALLFVDSVSGLASIDFRMDEWKVDIAVTGSQKGFMLPAGAGIVCVSPRALELGKTAKLPRCYWSYEDMVKANATGLLPLHAVDPDAVRAARGARHAARGGPRERLRPAPPAGRRVPPRRERRGGSRSVPGRPSGTPTR